jgi:hypothetical protein
MKHSVGKTITTTGSDVELFTVPNGYVAEVSTLFISNTAGSTASVSVFWQHGHDATHKIYIINGKSLNSKDYLQFSDGLVMKQGDSMKSKLTRQAYRLLLPLTYVKSFQCTLLMVNRVDKC